MAKPSQQDPAQQIVSPPDGVTSAATPTAQDSSSDQSTGAPPAAASETPGRRLSGRWIVVAVVVGYLLQVGWRVWLSRHLDVPAAHADEDGYLVAARVLAGDAGGQTTDNETFRRMGYPMLISPVYWFTQDAFTVYRSVLVINAVLNALVFPLLYLYARRTLVLPTRTALGGAFVAAAMPAVVFYSQFALTDAVLGTMVIAWLVLAHTWLAGTTTHARVLGALGSGAVAGLLFVTHIRGTMVVLVHVLLTVTVLVLRRSGWATTLAAIAGAGVVMTLDPILKAVSADAIDTAGNSPTGTTVNAITTLSGLGRMLGTADGQLWYLCIGTFGVGAVGVITAVLPLTRWRALRAEMSETATAARRIVVTATLFTTLLIALLSSAALPPGDNRINYFAYPRYIHMLFPLWLLIGLAALLSAKTRRQVLVLGGSAAALTLLTGAVVSIRTRVHGWGKFLGFDAPEMSFLGWRWHQIGVTRPTIVTLVLLAGIIVLIRRPRWGSALVMAGMALVVAANMVVATQKISIPMEVNQYRPGTPLIVREGHVREGDRVAFAKQQVVWYLQYNHMREIYWTPLLIWDQTSDPTPPSEANVVIAPYDPPSDAEVEAWDGSRYGFRLVVTDPNHGWALWRKG
ncbi:hypothetical protein Drose_17395 [Dactylosporangium roseum]|uniref:Glycosyltransferase RgtA/B/C/D-like domain-containing protein n=1 Tax=Dactylosporangium roseum TaxID=47989 RepID=A0ABY5ZEI6_9ACTN|nr:hypothetical protein [Dactylosporangium roseum]UWZ39832.1 hypothetical protein Drose_17395 [Dactylosporangium roseum]